MFSWNCRVGQSVRSGRRRATPCRRSVACVLDIWARRTAHNPQILAAAQHQSMKLQETVERCEECANIVEERCLSSLGCCGKRSRSCAGGTTRLRAPYQTRLIVVFGCASAKRTRSGPPTGHGSRTPPVAVGHLPLDTAADRWHRQPWHGAAPPAGPVRRGA